MAGLSAFSAMHSPLISPTVAWLSMVGIGITSNCRPATLRSLGTSARLPAIIPSLPRSNHSSGECSASSSSVSVSLGSRSRANEVSSADRVPSSEKASDLGSSSSSKTSPPPE